MLTNAYLLAKIGADTAENEQHFAEILPKTGRAGPRRRSVDPEPIRADGQAVPAPVHRRAASRGAASWLFLGVFGKEAIF